MKILKVDGNELHKQYRRQTNPQDCFVELDCKNAILSARYNPEIGNGVPMSVWHKHDLRWKIPCLVGDDANALLAEIAPLAEIVIEGYSSEWDGHNHVGRYTQDAMNARQKIETICENCNSQEVECWEADDWFSGQTPELTGEESDAELDEMEAKFESELEPHQMIGGLRNYLHGLRDKAKASAE